MHGFLSRQERCGGIVLHPVNYQLNERWATMRLEKPATIVDFLYHPDDGSDVLISRYLPFVIAPQARYSFGIVRNGSEGTIRAMRNPWLEFPSIDLSLIFGSGHPRIASRRLHNLTPETAESKMREILRMVREAINTQREAGALTS
jgi:hypothetical protein